MTESKHTPGPWMVRTLDMSIGSIDAESGIQVAQAQEVSVADRNSGHWERIANTRLIAAAPELLEALIEADRLYSATLLLAQSIEAGKWANNVRAAIAKATGEQA